MKPMNADDLKNKSPFPYEQTNIMTEVTRTVVDALCDCGGLQSDHLSSAHTWGHGPMWDNGCSQFMWVGFVYEDDEEGQ